MNTSAGKMSKRVERVRDLGQRLRDGLPGAFFRPNQVDELGMSRHQLRTLVRRGVVEHVARGLYRFADAEPLLLPAYKILSTSAGARVSQVDSALQYLVDLYTAWGRPEDAARYSKLRG